MLPFVAARGLNVIIRLPYLYPSFTRLNVVQNEESKDAAQMYRKFLEILESPLHDVVLKGSARRDWLAHCEEMLQQAMNLLKSSTSCSLVLCEKLGLELPRVVVKFVGLSQACQTLCLNIIEALVEVCGPREMFTAFMEALNMYTTCQTLLYCIPLLKGLALVFSRLQRRQMQFFMEASPGLLLVVRLTMQDEEVHLKGEETLAEFVETVHGNMVISGGELQATIVNEVVQVAHTVKVTCDTLLVAAEREDLQLKLGRFALELLASAGGRIAHPAERHITSVVVELVELLPLCGLSLLWLLTGDHIDSLIESTAIESAQDIAELYISKLEATKGVALAVYWALNNPRVAAAVEVSVDILQKQLELLGRKGVINALSVASSLLSTWSPTGLSTGMALVQLIVEISCPMITSSDGDDWLALTMKIMPFLESLQDVIVQASDTIVRRQAFIVIRKRIILMYLEVDGEQPSGPRIKKAMIYWVIQEVLPNATKFNSLQVLINNSHSPALVSLLLICIKDEVARVWPTNSQHRGILSNDGDSAEEAHQVQAVVSPFVSEEVLRVVGTVLRPTAGLPLDFCTHIDPIQSALNLYRFILIRESSGRTNYTGIISKKTLTRALTQWLLPLSELVGDVSLGSIVKEDILCSYLAMDRLGSVLKRCVELTQAALKFSE